MSLRNVHHLSNSEVCLELLIVRPNLSGQYKHEQYLSPAPKIELLTFSDRTSFSAHKT